MLATPKIADDTLLALDTSTPRAAVAVVAADGRIRVAPVDADQRHGRGLVPSIRDLLEASGVAARELGGIAVGLGPGSFTGLRVGLMAAKTYAYAAGIALVGLDSMELIARNAPLEYTHVIAVVDAQRGDIHVAEFDRDGGKFVRRGDSRTESVAGFFANLDPGAFVIGPGLERVDSSLSDRFLKDFPAIHTPDPHRLVEMAWEVWISGRRDDFRTLEPVYLRRSAAEDKQNARISPP